LPRRRLKILSPRFRNPPEDCLQAAAAGGFRAAPPEVLNANNYDKKQKLTIKKTQKYDEKRRKYLKTPKKTGHDYQN
jgi:hypothetical protein